MSVQQFIHTTYNFIKAKQSLYRPGQAQRVPKRVPGSYVSHIS